MKRGYQSTVELTKAIHFNPKYPENHNIYIPKINERHGMIFMNNDWRLIDKDELADDIYENKRDFIIQNLPKFIDKLDQFKKKSLLRFLENDDNDDEAIKNTKNDIKKLLYDYRKMAMNQKKEIEKANKRKPLQIVNLKKNNLELKQNNNFKEYDLESESETNSETNYESDYIPNSENNDLFFH
jgi:hypothetical protein